MEITEEQIAAIDINSEVWYYFSLKDPQLTLKVGRSFNRNDIIQRVFNVLCRSDKLDIIKDIITNDKNKIDITQGIKESILNGNLDNVKFLVENGFDFKKNCSKSLLKDIVHCKNIMILKYLIEECRYDIETNNGYLLTYACKHVLIDVILYLLTKNPSECSIINSLDFIINCSLIEIVKILIDHNKKLVNKALFIAATYDKDDIFQYLVEEQGAIINKDIESEAETGIWVKKFIKNHKLKRYFGIESEDSLNIKFPGLIGMEYDKYYYGYLLKKVGSRYILEDFESKYTILKQLNLGEPGFFTLE